MIEKLLREKCGFKNPHLKRLDGYDNANYLVETDGIKYVFKTYPFSEETLSLVNAEIEILLAISNEKGTYPEPIAFTDGSYLQVIEIEGKTTICRLLTFLEGTFLGDTIHTPKLLASLGTFLGELDKQLIPLTNYRFNAREWEWDIQYLHLNEKYIDDIPVARDRSLVLYFLQQFRLHVVPEIPYLRKSIIHNDANEWNILVNNNSIAGLIDFGDLAYTPLINELAVAATYVAYDKSDPLIWASYVIKAYHQVLPLQEKELSLLYYLIAARLCISVCNSAHARVVDPDNNYAGISEENAWKTLYHWLSISPIKAKNSFLKAAGMPIQQPFNIDEALTKRQQFISPILSLSYKTPIHMERAAFQYMYDVNGTTFLDAYNNIPHVGHSHPKVVAAGSKQMAQLNTNTRYVYDLLAEYAGKLLSEFPAQLNKVYFVNSGSAASDLAIRMATAHTGHRKIMVMEHGYHGNTQMSMDISDYKFSNKKGAGQKEHILKTPIPDTYRGKHQNNDGTAGHRYALEAIETIKQSEMPIAAFISEPIVGCGGQVPLAKGYLKELYPAIREQGGICISDEVQTGFGRLGDVFWGFEAQEVVPDIVILGKPMGNGHPMGAVVTTEEIAASFGKGVEFFSSFGGNPVSCAIGVATLEVIEEERLQENAKVVGEYYKSLFESLQKKFSCIGDVRGSGLFLGVEIIKDKNKTPDAALASYIKNELRNRNILISTDGPFDSVLKTKPPLCFTKENAKTVVDCIEDVLSSKN